VINVPAGKRQFHICTLCLVNSRGSKLSVPENNYHAQASSFVQSRGQSSNEFSRVPPASSQMSSLSVSSYIPSKSEGPNVHMNNQQDFSGIPAAIPMRDEHNNSYSQNGAQQYNNNNSLQQPPRRASSFEATNPQDDSYQKYSDSTSFDEDVPNNTVMGRRESSSGSYSRPTSEVNVPEMFDDEDEGDHSQSFASGDDQIKQPGYFASNWATSMITTTSSADSTMVDFPKPDGLNPFYSMLVARLEESISEEQMLTRLAMVRSYYRSEILSS